MSEEKRREEKKEGPSVDLESCGRRLRSLYDAWSDAKTAAFFNGAECVLLGSGANKEEELRYLKAVSLEIWLFSYELPDTVMAFVKKDGDDANEMHAIASGKKAKLLESARETIESSIKGKLTVHVKPKNEDGSAQVEALVKILQEKCAKVGACAKELKEGNLMQMAVEKLGGAEKLADVTSGIACVLSRKDEKEMKFVDNAVKLCSESMKFAVSEVENAIEEELKISHVKLSEKTEDAILAPAKTLGLKDISNEDVDICYPPIFQSGGEYDLKYNAVCSEKKLHFGSTPAVIHVSLGARHTQYCANIGRTYLIDPTETQEAVYEACLKAQKAAVEALQPGKSCKDVYAAAQKALEEAEKENEKLKDMNLSSKLNKNVGSILGLEFKDAFYMLSGKCESAIEEGMIFNVALGVNGLEETSADEKARSRHYAIMIADSVQVTAEGSSNKELTTSTKKLSDISYAVNESDEEDEEDGAEEDKDIANTGARGGVILDAKTRGDEAVTAKAEEDRQRKQKALADKKNAETYDRLMNAQNDVEKGGKGAGASADFVAYKSITDVPAPRKELVIAIDNDREAVLLPVCGMLVPFHVLAIKSCSVSQDAGASFIRINFQVPMGTSAAANAGYLPAIRFPNNIFLKELSYRSSDPKHANFVVNEIKTLRRNVVARETERAERATLVRQAKLQLSSGRVHRLTGLWMLPTFGGRGGRKAGTLEAHANGLRFIGARVDEQADIMYENIRSCFFQPAKKEVKTLIHFHLKNPIMIGKKKTHDVQFYQEVIEATENLDGSRKNMYDPDEIEEEQRERERQKRVQKEFAQFCKRVQEIWEKDFPKMGLEFDSPYHDLAFDGVAYKSTARIVPTASCLVELIDFPPLVIHANDIEIVNLERVGYHLKNFDMAIVFKDFNKDVHRIDQIPSKNLDNIKQWLTTLEVKYYEGKANLNWKPLLRQIKEDPESWLEAGGWEFLNNEPSSDEEEGEGSDPESEFEPSSDEEESESESESESMYDEDEEDEDASEEEDEDDEEVLDWDEMEEKARREDEEASDEDRRGDKRKKKSSKRR
jgi:nucleosome binding factor SPN SPT16 subunit|tara:strand:+ start:107 stop:3283 length:3177 start_codon:yes stop_codon:yes gene_type:complete